MAYKILSVGFDFPGGECEYVAHRSERSLLDADIVIFQPGLSSDYAVQASHNGQPCLYDDSSFALRRDLKHWHSELLNSFRAEKTIIVYLSKPETVYVATGETRWSGTGRSARGTRIVEPIETYSAIPLELRGVVPATGETMRPAGELGALSPYWKLCAPHSQYEVYLADDTKKPLFVTRTGDKIVGATVTGEKGSMLLLPNLVTDSEEFVGAEEEGEGNWTPTAIKFGKQLLDCIVELHTTLIARRDETPIPSWARESKYRLHEEVAIEKEIEEVDRGITALQDRRAALTEKRQKAGVLRGLIYEKGKPLEHAILETLRIMGFNAEPFRDAESEFDAVFVAPEGRFLGEAEGKDNGSINVDKLSQLERNIQEDFAKEGVTEHARGVLFGNAFRLAPVSERKDFFTAKCVSGAKRSGVALVRTPDLFEVAKYLKSSGDESFATLCRKAIFNAKGAIVEFPKVATTVQAAQA